MNISEKLRRAANRTTRLNSDVALLCEAALEAADIFDRTGNPPEVAMSWTKELPTELGWYWYRPPKNGNIKMGHVYLGLSGRLRFTYESRNKNISEFLHGEWCGPLIPPAVPEDKI